MMKSINYKFLIIPILALFMFSCEKNPEVEQLPERLFRPPLLNANVWAESVVTLTWTPVKDGIYEIEVSRDNLLFETDVETYRVEGTERLTVRDLSSKTRYSARVKAVSTNPKVGDSGWKEVTFVSL